MAYHHYGQSIVLFDSTLLVGAEDDNDQASLAGAAHFYTLEPGAPLALVEEMEAGPVFVYPNPVKSSLTIQGDHGLRRIIIYDYAGREIRTVKFSLSGSFTRVEDLSGLESGMYVVGIFNQDNEYRSIKVMKY